MTLEKYSKLIFALSEVAKNPQSTTGLIYLLNQIPSNTVIAELIKDAYEHESLKVIELLTVAYIEEVLPIEEIINIQRSPPVLYIMARVVGAILPVEDFDYLKSPNVGLSLSSMIIKRIDFLSSSGNSELMTDNMNWLANKFIKPQELYFKPPVLRDIDSDEDDYQDNEDEEVNHFLGLSNVYYGNHRQDMRVGGPLPPIQENAVYYRNHEDDEFT